MNEPFPGTATILTLSAVVLLLTLSAPDASGTEPNSRTVQLYNTYCVQCHGLSRNGKGINSRNMSVQPRDHTDAKGMGDIPDEELFHAIQDGGLSVNKSVLMPAWGGVLNETDIEELVEYLRQVCQCKTHK